MVEDAQQREVQPDFPQPEAAPDGVDPEIAQALQSPKIRGLLERTAAHYQQATAELATQAQGMMTALFPELANLNAQQTEGALRFMAQSQPQRFEQFKQLAGRAQQLVGVYKQQQAEVQAHQQQQAAHQLEQYKLAEGKKVDAVIPIEDPIRRNIFGLMERHYGIPEARMRAIASDPHMAPVVHSAEFQMILYEGLKAREAKQSLAAHRNNPVPGVQKPGVSQPHSSDDGAYAAIERQFRGKSLTAKQAGDLLIAKRAARS
jgi:hypothetical protein